MHYYPSCGGIKCNDVVTLLLLGKNCQFSQKNSPTLKGEQSTLGRVILLRHLLVDGCLKDLTEF
jgi:hypothetical protein